MEDIAWVLYALIGTQLVLIVGVLWCRETLVRVTNEMHKTLFDMASELHDIQSKMQAMNERQTLDRAPPRFSPRAEVISSPRRPRS